MAELNGAHPGAVLDTSYDREQAALVVDAGQVLDVLAWLRDTPGQEYTFLSSLHAADYLPAEPRFAVHYELLNRERYERIRVKALLPDPASGNGHHPTGIDGRAGGEGSVNGAGNGLAADSGTGSEGGSGGAPGEGRPTDPSSSSGRNGARLLPEIDSCVSLFPTADFQEREVFDFFGIVFRGHPDLRRMFMPEDYGGHPQRRDFPIGGEPVIFTRDEPSDPGWWR
jgi:NADH:ubiquinone oxidoreductase subunit C